MTHDEAVDRPALRVDDAAGRPAASSRQATATLTQLHTFDEIIDARSPAEFAEDHIPGAISCPVLDDAQRAQIGTLHKQESPFAAKRLGAAWVARNIANHIEQKFQTRDRRWRPVVYCWRGGKRSGAFVTVLRQIGWDARQLEGGYKAYRRHVVARLQSLPQSLRYTVVSGATGSGKSRLLQALADLGAQVLDLEALAAHKGSVLGDLPGAPQPSQKRFETEILATLERLDPAREVFVEAESRRIGALQVPDPLLRAMRASSCVRIEATLEARVRFLLEDYDYFLADPGRLGERLNCLRGLQSEERLAHWRDLALSGRWPELVGELLEHHYDPLYRRSQGRNYAGFEHARVCRTGDLSRPAVGAIAAGLLRRD